MIVNDGRGWIRLSVGGKLVTVHGEQIAPDSQPAYFIASIKSLAKWENGDPITPGDVDEIRRTLEKDFLDRNERLRWG